MDDYLLAQHSELEWVHWWFVGRRAIVADVLRRRLPPAPTAAPRRIIDLGCGAGAMLPILRPLGDVAAIDTSPEAVAACRARFPDIDVRLGRVPEALPEPATADLVTAFDVIEHIADDREAVRAIAASLRPGGLFACTVPAYQRLWSAHDELNHHHRRYTRRSLVRLLRGSGFEVQWASYFNTLLLPAVVVVRMGQRLRGRHTTPASDLDVKVGPFNQALARLFGAERYLLRLSPLPAGVSIIAIARRPLDIPRSSDDG